MRRSRNNLASYATLNKKDKSLYAKYKTGRTSKVTSFLQTPTEPFILPYAFRLIANTSIITVKIRQEKIGKLIEASLPNMP